MRRGLPSLTAIKAFEAAGRHLSFKKAAAELEVTPTAIGQQIRSLETHLGMPLFRRSPKGLHLTEAGHACLPGVQGGFDQLADAIAKVRYASEKDDITISVTPSFGNHWLIPRLGNFLSAHPKINVRVIATERMVNFNQDAVDLAIRAGLGRYGGLHSEKLWSELVYPACSPSLMTGPNPLTRIANLRHHRLIHHISPVFSALAPDWRAWLREAGVQGINLSDGGMRFSSVGDVVRAAVRGYGVGLGLASLMMDELDSGRLVAPFSLRLPISRSYFLVYPERNASSRRTRTFIAWLMSMARATRRSRWLANDRGG